MVDSATIQYEPPWIQLGIHLILTGKPSEWPAATKESWISDR
jgi:hypothetical protein